MAAEVFTRFLPELLIAIRDCLLIVSDECLAKGLIPESVYQRVLDLGPSDKVKARTLPLAVRTSIKGVLSCS